MTFSSHLRAKAIQALDDLFGFLRARHIYILGLMDVDTIRRFGDRPAMEKTKDLGEGAFFEKAH